MDYTGKDAPDPPADTNLHVLLGYPETPGRSVNTPYLWPILSPHPTNPFPTPTLLPTSPLPWSCHPPPQAPHWPPDSYIDREHMLPLTAPVRPPEPGAALLPTTHHNLQQTHMPHTALHRAGVPGRLLNLIMRPASRPSISLLISAPRQEAASGN